MFFRRKYFRPGGQLVGSHSARAELNSPRAPGELIGDSSREELNRQAAEAATIFEDSWAFRADHISPLLPGALF